MRAAINDFAQKSEDSELIFNFYEAKGHSQPRNVSCSNNIEGGHQIVLLICLEFSC